MDFHGFFDFFRLYRVRNRPESFGMDNKHVCRVCGRSAGAGAAPRRRRGPTSTKIDEVSTNSRAAPPTLTVCGPRWIWRKIPEFGRENFENRNFLKERIEILKICSDSFKKHVSA